MATYSTKGRHKMMKKAVGGLALLGLLIGVSGTAHAGDLITNGSFETTTHGNGQLGFNTDATGWTNGNDGHGHHGYNFLYESGTADTTGANGVDGLVKLWGPGTGSNNGLTSSPSGGNFIAMDGAYQVAAISQTVNGLVAGQMYAVSFYWAGAQQSGFSGATTDKFTVSLGSESHDTSVVDVVSHGFSGWQQETINFTATTDGSEVLSFLATGTPTGVPPFALLDGVSMNAIPESRFGFGFLVCLGGTTAFLRLRRARAKKSAA